MGYEQAPATRMLATNCVMCNRPLVDAASVEAGIGPVCRKKYGYAAEITEEHRCEANKRIHSIALNRRDKQTSVLIREIEDMGLGVLAHSLRAAVSDFTIFEENDKLVLKAPYSEAIFGVPGRMWDRKRKVTTFPITSRVQLFEALKCGWPRGIGLGKKGLFWL